MSHCKNKGEIPKRRKRKIKMKDGSFRSLFPLPHPMGLEFLKSEMYQSRVRGLKFPPECGKWTARNPPQAYPCPTVLWL